jgi:hypothetical protein
MPREGDYRICVCQACVGKGGPTGLVISAHEWKSHRRLARACKQLQVPVSQSKATNLKVEEDPLSSDSEQLTRLIFGMTLNNEISPDDQNDPLWNVKPPPEATRPIQHDTYSTPISPERLIETVSQLIDSTPVGTDRNMPLALDAALPKTESFKVIVREKKSKLERRLTRAFLHINTKRAISRLDKIRSSLNSLKSLIEQLERCPVQNCAVLCKIDRHNCASIMQYFR